MGDSPVRKILLRQAIFSNRPNDFSNLYQHHNDSDCINFRLLKSDGNSFVNFIYTPTIHYIKVFRNFVFFAQNPDDVLIILA
jgi:hypothetical protein